MITVLRVVILPSIGAKIITLTVYLSSPELHFSHSTFLQMTVTYQANLSDTEYNGWTNYETWNVALWLQNDVNLYYLCRDIGNYVDTIDLLNDDGIVATPDGVRYNDPKVNVIEINSEVFDF